MQRQGHSSLAKFVIKQHLQQALTPATSSLLPALHLAVSLPWQMISFSPPPVCPGIGPEVPALFKGNKKGMLLTEARSLCACAP